MPRNSTSLAEPLRGHALRNHHLRERALVRAQTAPPLAHALVQIRAGALQMTRLEFARQSGIGRGTLRDLELGIHTPTRHTLQQFVDFCRRHKVSPDQLEELQRLYAGPGRTLGQFIARLELRAGSPRELARRVGISPATLWEYRRGNFPLPLVLLRRLCRAVNQDPVPAEALWHEAERQRLLDRGYPEALAEFWVLCTRQGVAEKHLLGLGMNTATVRRLRYLEFPPWREVAAAAQRLCRDPDELCALQKLWAHGEQEQEQNVQPDGYGARLQELRKQQGITRREMADLFGIGGKKPARIIKYIEEDGFYSAQAYPAGLAAILTTEDVARAALLERWQERRKQFHRRRRPETRTDLRLARELYGFGIPDMEPVLGYNRLEYQRIERGVSALLDTARARILQAIHQAGQRRIDALLERRQTRDTERGAWQQPTSMAEMVALLAKREGGLIPLARCLRQAGLNGFWPGRLSAIAQSREVPAWPVLEQVGRACGISDLAEVYRDWTDRYRALLQAQGRSPLGVEVRLLIAEVASTPRAFSPRLGFNYSVLVRDLQRLDRDEAVRWFHVERILRAAELPEDDLRWRAIHAWWYTAAEREGRSNGHARRRSPSAAASG